MDRPLLIGENAGIRWHTLGFGISIFCFVLIVDVMFELVSPVVGTNGHFSTVFVGFVVGGLGIYVGYTYEKNRLVQGVVLGVSTGVLFITVMYVLTVWMTVGQNAVVAICILSLGGGAGAYAYVDRGIFLSWYVVAMPVAGVMFRLYLEGGFFFTDFTPLEAAMRAAVDGLAVGIGIGSVGYLVGTFFRQPPTPAGGFQADR